MPNKPNSEFHKMLKQITESRKEEMSKIFNRPSLISPMVFNIEVPKVKAPTIDLDFKSLNINSLLGDYFKENSLSETMKKAVSDSIKNIDFDSFKLYSDNDENSNEEVIKMGDYKVSSYTTISRTTYVEMAPPKVLDDVVTDESELKNDKLIKDYTPLIDFTFEWNQKLALNFSNNPSMYALVFTDVISIQFLITLHVLHFVVAWVLVEAKHKLETKLDKKEKE